MCFFYIRVQFTEGSLSPEQMSRKAGTWNKQPGAETWASACSQERIQKNMMDGEAGSLEVDSKIGWWSAGMS